MNRPEINVTPLIDVLLVLLIIFMVVTPTKLSSFKAKVPRESASTQPAGPHPDTLVVAVGDDMSLRLNAETDLGVVNDPQKMIDRLRSIFQQRVENYGSGASGEQAVPRSVFIKAPRGLDYGSVAKVVDAVKISGAEPIALQIDNLN
jgi:biopolymer transport protein ExbD